MKKLSIILLGAIALVFSTPNASAQGDFKTAYIEEVQVIGEASQDGIDGIIFNVIFEVQGLKDKQVVAMVDFLYARDLKPVVDRNKKFVDEEGNVMAYTMFVPKSNDEKREETIFIPFTELHLTKYAHKLRYRVQILDEDYEITSKAVTGEFHINGENFLVW